MRPDQAILFSDIDGTLIDRDLFMPPENADAIAEFTSRGACFSLATGRAPLSSHFVTSKLPKLTPCVVFNGGGIYDFSRGEMLWQITLDCSARKVARYVFDHAPYASVEVHVGARIYLARSSPRGAVHVGQAGTGVTECGFDQIPPDGWNKVLFAAEPEQIELLMKELIPFEAGEYTLVRTSPVYYEIVPKGVSKSTAMFRLADLLGIPHKHIFAIGDYYNDIEMLSAAAVSACVESSPPELKRIAKAVCPDVRNGSVAHFIRMIESEYFD